ncbi:MAG: hypothetical protein ACK52W_07585 [Alphaproteobacteria bacterium]
MAGIVELYRKHKELLSPYFKSEQDAAECERRAEMGDDRAMRILSLAYDAKEKRNINLLKNVSSSDSVAEYEIIEKMIFFSSDFAARDLWHDCALKAQNHDALEFVTAVNQGLRSPLINHAQWMPSLVPFEGALLNDYQKLVQPYSTNYKTAYYWDSEYRKEWRFIPQGSLRFEVGLIPRVYEGLNVNYSVLSTNSTFQILYRQSPPSKWPTEKSTYRYTEDYPLFPKNNWYFSKSAPEALEICALAGSAEAARLLSRIYDQSTFYEKIKEQKWFGGPIYQPNPLHDSVKAKEWERVAEHLEGKTTATEREKFLKEFLFSQDKTPEGLYNIGYALCHNPHIGDFDRGVSYLKHAANLGDANAARELGEQYQTSAEMNQNSPEQMKFAYFWYKVAASTPMKVKDTDGKTIAYDGHPNAKARVAYLEKANPALKKTQFNEAELRNPSREHIRQYPASMWAAEIPITDVSNLVYSPEHGGITERMEKAVQAIDSHVKEFEVMTGAIQAKIDDLIARQAVLDGRVEGLKGEEISAIRHNDALTSEQRKSERAIRISKDRWIKETAANLGGTAVVGWMTGGASFFAETLRFVGHGHPNAPGMYGANLLRANKVRAAGYYAVMENEVAHHQALIDELEARKIDTSKFPDEIRALSQAVQEVADSAPMKKLMKDETRSRAVVEGYLRQRILKSGLENCRFLEDYSKQNGIDSVDELLTTFEKQDARLHQALHNLCYGHANSNDMAVLLADVNAMRGNTLQPHEKALKRFVERVVKGNIAHYMTRASQIDVITDLKLVDFSTMSVDHRKANADLVRGTREPSAEKQGRRLVDNATRLALTSMFSNQFGVSHIGQYDVTRMFSYFLHRHGKDELIAAELHDGQVTDVQQPKRVGLKTSREMQGFVERAKESAHRGRESQPDVGDLFLRVCGYEYYLPQAVITSGRGNRFKENPEAPIAYPMVNRVVQDFIERMSLTNIATYRQQVGEKLDSVIAQTFIDFFQQAGREHAEKFAVERERLRDAHSNDNYGPRFDAYEDKITDNILTKFPDFVKIYERNLTKELQGAPEPEAAILQQQIDSLNQNAKDYLAPAVPKQGSFEARQAARALDHRGTNMTEPWRFGS